MFGDAFAAVCHGAMDATMTVTGDTVDVTASADASAAAIGTVDAAAVAVAVVATAPSVTNSTIAVLVAYK